MNNVIEYVLNNKVNVCIVALNQQQAIYSSIDIKGKLQWINKSHHINYYGSNNIIFNNGSKIDFVLNNNSEYIRGKSYDLLLFNNNVYERDPVFLVSAKKHGTLLY